MIRFQTLMRAAILSVALVPGLGSVAFAQSPALPERFQQDPVLKIAMNAEYPPFELVDPTTGEIVGFDVDLIQAIAAKLGLTVTIENSQFEQLPAALETGRIDMIISGMYDTPARRELFDFVDYMLAGPQVYKLKTNEMTELTEICGETISTIRGTSYPDVVERWSEENCVANGLPAVVQMVDVDRAQQQINIRTGRAVAGVQGLESLGEGIGGMEDFDLLGDPLSPALMGMAFLKSDTELRDAVQTALIELIDEGTYDEIVDTWHLGASAYREATINEGPQP